jgi:hypothetical protein
MVEGLPPAQQTAAPSEAGYVHGNLYPLSHNLSDLSREAGYKVEKQQRQGLEEPIMLRRNVDMPLSCRHAAPDRVGFNLHL